MIRFLLFVTLLLSIYSADAQRRHKHKRIEIDEKKETTVDVVPLELPTNNNSNNGPINVSIMFEHHYPYCGGAYPTDEQMNNYQVIRNSNFILVNIETGEQQIVRTDSTGTLDLSLPPGEYGIKEMFKNCTFAEFLKNNPMSQRTDVQLMGEDCYKNWWASYMGEFTVTSPNLIIRDTYSTHDACFTGNNPCIVYLGPYPP